MKKLGIDVRIVIVSVIYLFLSMLNLKYPGFYSDETISILQSKFIGRDINELDMSKFLKFHYSKYYVVINNKFYPIMGHVEYVGSIESYLLLPLKFIWENKIHLARIIPIFFSLLFIIFSYKIILDWFSKDIAFCSMLLVSISPFFVYYSRIGLYSEEIFNLSFFIMSIYFFNLFAVKNRATYLAISCFLLGLGLSHKITMIFYFLGLVIILFLFKNFLNISKLFKLKNLCISIIFFILGSFPLIYYNIASKGKTIKLIFESLFSHKYVNFSNLNILNNLHVRIKHFIDIVSGSFNCPEIINSIGYKFFETSVNKIFLLINFLIFLLFIYFVLKNKIDKKIKIITMFYMIIFISSIFTVSHLSP